MECQHRGLACPDAAIRVIYFDLVYQWRQIADELEAIERQQRNQIERARKLGRNDLGGAP
jgi:hypothetical protein